jgi:hypothetical protein
MALIGLITEDYGDKSERPADWFGLLERLTDAILDEELTDPNPHKVAHTEYPFFSERQLDLRRDRETGLKAAEETGTDGRDYRRPTKRRRTNYENWRVDKEAAGRNAERQAQYKRDTAAGRPASYNLRDTGGELTEPFVAAAGVGALWKERLSRAY